MKKIVIALRGTFRLSNAAIAMLAALKSRTPIMALGDENRLMGWGNPQDDSEDPVNYWDIPRDDPDLLTVFEALGPEVAYSGTILAAVEVPDNHSFRIKHSSEGEVLSLVKED